MKTMLSSFAVSVLFSASLQAKPISFADQKLAGDTKGNGGDVVACYNRDNQITSVELLDHYEGRTRYGMKLGFGPENLNYMEKIQFVLNRLGEIDPQRAGRMWEEATNFEKNTYFWPDAVLTDISDSNHIAVPHGCKIEQIAIQKAPEFPGEKYFTVAKDLWDRLDASGKAGLVLHEILFKEAIRLGQENSIKSRFYNAFVSQEELLTGKSTFLGYFQTLDVVGLEKSNYYKNRGILLEGLKYEDVEGVLTVYAWALLSGPNESPWILQNGMQLFLRKGTSLNFYENGDLCAGGAARPFEYKVGGETFSFEANHFMFDQNGSLIHGIMNGNHKFSFLGQRMEFEPYVRFFPDGTLKAGLLVQNQIFSSNLNGCQIQVPSNKARVEQNNAQKLSKISLRWPYNNYMKDVCFPKLSGNLHKIDFLNNVILTFNDKGWVKEITNEAAEEYGEGDSLKLPVANSIVSFELTSKFPIKFHENGAIKSGLLGERYDNYPPLTFVEFDLNGKIIPRD